MAQVTGIVKLYVDGKLYRSKPGAKLKTGGKKRTAVTGYAVYGYAEEIEAAELDATIAHTSDTDVAAINGITNGTLRFETDTGQTLMVAHAFVSEPCELASGGDLSLKMQGDPAEAE
jgi:hypothetical protein